MKVSAELSIKRSKAGLLGGVSCYFARGPEHYRKMSLKGWSDPVKKAERLKKQNAVSLKKAHAASMRKFQLLKAGTAMTPVDALREHIKNSADPRKAVKELLKGLKR